MKADGRDSLPRAVDYMAKDLSGFGGIWGVYRAVHGK